MVDCARLATAALLLTAFSLGSGQVVDLEAVPPLVCECFHNSNRSTAEIQTCRRDEEALVCTSAEVPQLPYGYKWIQGYGLYKLYRLARSYDEAVQQCRLDGARLAVPSNETQLATLTTTLADDLASTVAYLGVVGDDAGDAWYGIDGEVVTYLPWAAGQPNITNGRCVVLNEDGTYSSVQCDDQRPFFCEKVITDELLDDYVWVEEAARFYLTPGNHVTWDDAESACEAAGATLAIPDSILRAEAILGLLASDTNDVFVGFTDREEESNFVSVTGRRLVDMEFQDWLNGQANGGVGQDCLLLWAGGFYVDIECDSNHRYVCEYAP